MAISFYLAAPFGRQAELRAYADKLRDLGHTVTSRWLMEDEAVYKTLGPKGTAEMDLADIDNAGVLISFTEPPDSKVPPRGGRHVEFGYAYATGRELWVVGYRENIFHHLRGVRLFDTFADVLEELT